MLYLESRGSPDVDEKSRVQALGCTQPLLLMRTGQVERHTHHDTRHGIAPLLAAFDIAAGTMIGRASTSAVMKRPPHSVELPEPKPFRFGLTSPASPPQRGHERAVLIPRPRDHSPTVPYRLGGLLYKLGSV